MGEWFKVEDEIPSDWQCVIATGFDYGNFSNKRHYVICEYFDGLWVGDEGEEFKYITHWQPLQELKRE